MNVIMMTYYQRQAQLNKTLASIQGDDFVVIIVDDCSPDDIVLPETSYLVEVIKLKEKNYPSNEPAYNAGFIAAKKYNPDIVIIQNAECYHVGDIMGYAKQNVTDSNYITFSCFSLDQSTTADRHNINEVIRQNNHIVKKTGGLGWYNHPVHRPVGFEFCAAIKFSNIVKINGYDERLSAGLSYGDVYLLHRIKMIGCKVEIPIDPFVVHQFHYSAPPRPDASKLRHRNKTLYQQLIKEDNYRAVHIYTQDL